MNREKVIEGFSQPRRKWLVFLAVGIGTFMSALDASVVNTILPVIRGYFIAAVSSVEWIVTIYLLVVSSLLLTFGRLGDIHGHKRIYVSGFLIFVAASASCGLAPSVEILVISRAIQAFGAAMLFANSPAILTKSFHPAQRGQALGMQATMTYLGLTVGPSLGGWLAESFGWRTVFYINVPIGLIAFGLSLAFIYSDKPEKASTERFDWVGAVLFSASLILLLLALNKGNDWGWTSLPFIACVMAAALIMAVFIQIERRTISPMLALSLFQRRLFSASTASAVLNYICLYSVIFLMPFYLIQGRGLNPAQAGVLLTMQPIIMAASAPLSGLLSDRIGSRLLSTSGMAILSLGLFLLSRLGPNSPYSVILSGLAVTGLGTGIFISPNTSALLGSAPRQRQGIASGILATARNVGMVLGVGLAGASLSSISGLQGDNSVFQAVQVGLETGAGIALLGIFVSIIRGNKVE